MREPLPNQLSGAARPNEVAGDAAPPGSPPPQSGATTETPSVIRRLVRNPLVVRFGIVAVIVLGGLLVRDFISGSPDALRVGDCIDTPTSDAGISDVQHHPCDQAHTGEVFGVFQYA